MVTRRCKIAETPPLQLGTSLPSKDPLLFSLSPFTRLRESPMMLTRVCNYLGLVQIGGAQGNRRTGCMEQREAYIKSILRLQQEQQHVRSSMATTYQSPKTFECLGLRPGGAWLAEWMRGKVMGERGEWEVEGEGSLVLTSSSGACILK